MSNISTVREFLLLVFSEVQELQLVHAALFLLVYLATLTGNLLIVVIIALDQCFHTPMYFFLRNPVLIDLCYISVTFPNSITISLNNCRSFSFLSYATQLFLVALFPASEFFVLTVMSYDRYVAICLPLGYEVVMKPGACGKMVAASWLSAGLFGVLFSASTFPLSFCGSNVVRHFFCNIPSLLKITCSEYHSTINVSVTFALAIAAVRSISFVALYIHIFRALLRMPAAKRRAKVFSPCLSHFIVVTVFSTDVFGYLKSPSHSFSLFDLLMSVLYAVVPPALNSLIYSLGNRDFKAALWTVLKGDSPGLLYRLKCPFPRADIQSFS